MTENNTNINNSTIDNLSTNNVTTNNVTTNNVTTNNAATNKVTTYNSINNNGANYGMDNPFVTLRPIERPKPHEFLEKFTDELPFFVKAIFLYALAYAICRYHNKNGFTTPIIAVGSLFFFKIMLQKIGITIKKVTYLYLVIAIALGFNCFVSDDYFIVNTNFWIALLLFTAFLLHNAYDCSKWGLGAHISAFLESTFGLLGHMFMMFNDRATYKTKHGDNRKEKKNSGLKTNIVLGIALSLGLLMVILPLLISADQFFAEAVGNFVDALFDELAAIFNIFDSESNHTVIKFTFYTIMLFLVVYGMIRKLCCHNIKVNTKENTKYSAATAITINAVLGFVYVVFSGFQIFYLFLGNMTLPEHATYSEYAHEGFFQLVIVCLINMLLVLAILHIFENTMALKVSLTVISACTYIMMASSVLRMTMYVDAYDLSYLRYFVFWAILVIFLAMTGIVIYTFKQNFPIFRYCMAVLAIVYMCFAYSNPTYTITKYNLEKSYTLNSDGEYVSDADIDYLTEIYNAGSAKAVCDTALKYNDTELFESFYRYYHSSDADYLTDFRKLNLNKLIETSVVDKCKKQLYNY